MRVSQFIVSVTRRQQILWAVSALVLVAVSGSAKNRAVIRAVPAQAPSVPGLCL